MSSIRDQLSSYGKQHKRQGRIAATIDMSRMSNLSCGAKCLKYFVMGLAAFLVAVGIIVLGVGASMVNSTTAEITGPGFTNAVIACGVFIAATGTLGLIGGKLESRLMLYSFALFMGIWFLILLILSSYAVSKQGQEFDIISRGWSGLSMPARISIQESWVCCGAATYNDKFKGDPCPRYANDDNRPVEGSKRPCIPLIVPEFRAMWFTFGVCGIVLAVILLSGLITSCLLMSSINNANAELLKRRRTAG